MNEKRVTPRWSINQKASLNFIDQLDWNECQLEDLNLKGMKISMDKRLPKDASGRLSVVLADGFAMRVEVKTCWEKEEPGYYQYGVSFTRVWDEDRDKIFQYYRQNYPAQFKQLWWEGRF